MTRLARLAGALVLVCFGLILGSGPSFAATDPPVVTGVTVADQATLVQVSWSLTSGGGGLVLEYGTVSCAGAFTTMWSSAVKAESTITSNITKSTALAGFAAGYYGVRVRHEPLSGSGGVATYSAVVPHTLGTPSTPTPTCTTSTPSPTTTTSTPTVAPTTGGPLPTIPPTTTTPTTPPTTTPPTTGTGTTQVSGTVSLDPDQFRVIVTALALISASVAGLVLHGRGK